MPKALIVRTAGINCEVELARAFKLAGAEPEVVHVRALVEEPERIAKADLIGFPGGFSHGDDVASGRVFAVTLRNRLAEPLKQAANNGVPIIGICNGFQVLVRLGLLPNVGEQSASLTQNASGRFIDRWVGVDVPERSACVWTEPLRGISEDIGVLPIAHGEGRFIASEEELDRLGAGGQIALTYREDINGSLRSVAGVCDPSGRVFGLMPHPERYLDWNRHPFWTRLGDDVKASGTPGLAMFEAAVKASVGAGV